MLDKTNPYAHVKYCQSSSQIALSCPACRWSLLKWSVPRPGRSLEERLTPEDETWLAEMKIGWSEFSQVTNIGISESHKAGKG
jgi:hypothetical protein